MDDSKPIIKDILQLMVTIYQDHPQQYVLHVLKTVRSLISNTNSKFLITKFLDYGNVWQRRRVHKINANIIKRNCKYDPYNVCSVKQL